MSGALAEAVLLIALLASGLAERLSEILSHFFWPAYVALFVLSVGTAFVLLSFPFSFVRYRLMKRFDISKQSMRGWLFDTLKGMLLSLSLSTVISEFLLLIIRLTVYWWAVLFLLYLLVTALYSTLFPLLFTRFFSKVSPLQEGDLRKRIDRLLQKAGAGNIDVGILGESRRSSGVNAFVTGLGRGKRVVLYDNLIKSFPPQEVEAVVAHELGHYVHRDTLRSSILQAVYVLLILLLLYRISPFLLHSGYICSMNDPAILLWFSLTGGAISFLFSPLIALYSRRRERNADLYSLQLTGNPEAFISSEKRLCDANLMDENPSRVRHLLFDTHPDTMERIRMGEEFDSHISRQH